MYAIIHSNINVLLNRQQHQEFFSAQNENYATYLFIYLFQVLLHKLFTTIQ